MRLMLNYFDNLFVIILPSTLFAFSVLTLLVGHQEEHLVCKNLSDEVLV